GTPLSACFKIPMICASLYRAFFIKISSDYYAEKILLVNTTNFRGDYRTTSVFTMPSFSNGSGQISGAIVFQRRWWKSELALSLWDGIDCHCSE
ncbi:MAG: hypothetical protein Q9M48_00580, partial [Rhodobacterales bacterium]|nr:hypothetical protein [Rhodobacterales bacterium]